MTTSTLIARMPERVHPRTSGTAFERARVAAAAGFLAGVLLALTGFAWDVQWHTDVGPDSFFTAPHLVLYGGIAVSGIICLAMVLLTTRYARRGLSAAMEGTTEILGGRFRGPSGYIVGGFGALFFLLYGLMDQWWHTLYGFDVTLVSPPHVGLIFSIMVSMAGCLIALAWHVRTARGWRAVLASTGCALAAATLVMFITPTLTDLLPWALLGRISWPNTVISALFPAAILLVVSIVRRPWAGVLFGVVFTLLDVALTTIVPAITRDYAASIGLFMRDNARGEAVVPGLAPTYVLAAGAAVDLLLLAARRFGWRPAIAVPVAGAAAALVLRLLEADLPLYQASAARAPEIQAMIAERSAAVAPASLVLAPVIGAAAGWFGWLLGIVLRGREMGRVESDRAAVLPAAAIAALVLLLLPASSLAHAADPHHETIQAGPYSVVVGFSEWPVLAERSIDITFEPEGGIADKTATIRMTDADGELFVVGPLGRHPRQRDLWGLDLIALPAAGDWTMEVTVDGLLGSGTGTLRGIPVGERPGPPPAPLWAMASLPLLFLIWLGARGWRMVRPGTAEAARAWLP